MGPVGGTFLMPCSDSIPGGERRTAVKVVGRVNVVTHGSVNLEPGVKTTYLQAAASGSWPPMSCEVQPMGGGPK